jgi:poly-gamma-glutamate synthesis protein (capsule biosynthesis protein)
VGVVLFFVLVYVIFLSGGGGKSPKQATTPGHTTTPVTFPKHSPLNPDWRGSGKPVTLAFGGDVHFAGAVGQRLATNPATALGTTVAQLFSGAQLSMVNLETAVTTGSCPQPQSKQFIFNTGASAITALRSAGITLATQANDHGMDCGQTGLSQDLSIAAAAKYPIIGIGSNASQAFAPYRTTINGQRIAIIAATQVIAANLVSTWAATGSQPGVASALNPSELVTAVQTARRTSDTVVVYLHWGTELQACPDTQQIPLAQQLVNAGADIVIGTNAHVLLGAGYLGSAYVDYGLGNFAFYDDSAPETDSGALLVTVVGRHITNSVFRPATIVNGLPEPLTGTPGTTALASWNAARGCTSLATAPSVSLATEQGETSAFTAPTTTTNPAVTTTTTGGDAATTTTTTTKPTATTTTTTAPTDNAG